MNTTKRSRTKALNEKAEFGLANHERSVQRTFEAFAKAVANAAEVAGGYGLSRLIVASAETVFRAEGLNHWQDAIRDCLKPDFLRSIRFSSSSSMSSRPWGHAG